MHSGRWNEGKRDDWKHKKCAVRTERWRLINHSKLFDIEADPGETTDVAAAHPEVVNRLQAAFDKWWESAVPLMVNEGLPTVSPEDQPLARRYESELKEHGISTWEPAEHFDLHATSR